MFHIELPSAIKKKKKKAGERREHYMKNKTKYLTKQSPNAKEEIMILGKYKVVGQCESV